MYQHSKYNPPSDNLLTVNQGALRLLLCNWLKNAIYHTEDSYPKARIPNYTSFPAATQSCCRDVPLKRVEGATFPTYLSAIALQWAAAKQLLPLQLATQLVDRLYADQSQDTPAQLNLDAHFTVQIISSGFIRFELNDRGLAVWLQHLVSHPPLVLPDDTNNSAPLPDQPPLPQEGLFAAQHAHARCCSLLQLAQQQGMISLAQPESHPWCILPDLIPWLEDSSPPIASATGEPVQASFRLMHPAERQVICQLIDCLDELFAPTRTISDRATFWQKQATSLAQAFQTFHRQCRFLQEKPDLALARLGLIQVIQTVLWLILHTRLGVIAPKEL